MTQPWQPLANPAGQYRRAVRTYLREWIVGQDVGGIDHVYPSEPVEWMYDYWRDSQADKACLVACIVGTDDESRVADTGPTSPGGKLVHYETTLEVRHLTYEVDEGGAGDTGEDDFDRIVDGLKDCLRGQGRDLGRPDVILEIGEYPREGAIVTERDPISVDGDGSVERVARIIFRVSLYIGDGTNPAQP